MGIFSNESIVSFIPDDEIKMSYRKQNVIDCCNKVWGDAKKYSTKDVTDHEENFTFPKLNRNYPA